MQTQGVHLTSCSGQRKPTLLMLCRSQDCPQPGFNKISHLKGAKILSTGGLITMWINHSFTREKVP